MAAFVDEEELSDEFQMFGVELSDENVVDKLKELCITYRLEAVGVVEEWVAFTHSRGITTCDMNLDHLSRFERDLEKKKGSKTTPKTPASAAKTPKSRVNQFINDDDGILDSYTSPAAPKSKGSKRQLTTPENRSVKKGTAVFSPSVVVNSPANAKLSESYKNRSGTGDVIASLNTPLTKMSWKGETANVKIEVHPECLSTQYKYMFEKNIDKILVLDDIIEDAAELYKNEVGDQLEFAPAALPAQEQVTIIGRIACDSNGRLNAKSVILEGSRDNCGGRSVALDLSRLDNCSLFPGQIVAMEGMNVSGSQFVVKRILDQPLPKPAYFQKVEGPVSILVASGPYSTCDSLSYEPLNDLIKTIQEQTPDVCVMMGPFIDEKNDALGTMTDTTFDAFFKELITTVLHATEALNTRMILVPSSRDVHHHMVYPQPAYEFAEKYERVTFVSDPTIVTINHVTVGLTSTDTLFHLGQQELSFGLADRIPRLVRHLIQQQRFYPLYPPGEDVNIDFEHYVSHARLPVTPSLLLLPSRLAQFAKDVGGCCCVNPGSLARGKSGGSYAQVVIRPSDDALSLARNISARVVKI